MWKQNIFTKKGSVHWEKNAIESKAFLSKSMCIMDSNQYAIELVTFIGFCSIFLWINNMLLEKNAFDSIAFFSQCAKSTYIIDSKKYSIKNDTYATNSIVFHLNQW